MDYISPPSEVALVATETLAVGAVTALLLSLGYMLVGAPIQLIGLMFSKGSRYHRRLISTLVLLVPLLTGAILGGALVVAANSSSQAWFATPVACVAVGTALALRSQRKWLDWLRVRQTCAAFDWSTQNSIALRQAAFGFLMLQISVVIIMCALAPWIVTPVDAELRVAASFVAAAATLLTALAITQLTTRRFATMWVVRRYRWLTEASDGATGSGLLDVIPDPWVVRRSRRDSMRCEFAAAVATRFAQLTKRLPEPARGAHRAGCSRMVTELVSSSDKSLSAHALVACVTGPLPAAERITPYDIEDAQVGLFRAMGLGTALDQLPIVSQILKSARWLFALTF